MGFVSVVKSRKLKIELRTVTYGQIIHSQSNLPAILFNFLNPKSKLELMVLFCVLFTLQSCILHNLSFIIQLTLLNYVFIFI